MIRTPRRSTLDTNLTKWLLKCEGSLLEGKEKKHNMVSIMRRLAELNENNDEDAKLKTEVKGHKNLKKMWKVVQAKNIKEKKMKG